MKRWSRSPGRLIEAGIILVVLGAAPALTWAQAPRIERVILTQAQGYLTVSFRLEHGLAPREVRLAVAVGLPTTFIYRLELAELPTLWPARSVAQAEVRRIVKYDPLADKYSVVTLGLPDPARITADPDQAQRFAAEVEGLRVAPMSLLEPEKSYRLSLRAVLRTKPAPPVFRYLSGWLNLGLTSEPYQVEIRR